MVVPSSLQRANSLATSRSAWIGLFFLTVGLGLLDSGCFTVTTLGRTPSQPPSEPDDSFFSCSPEKKNRDRNGPKTKDKPKQKMKTPISESSKDRPAEEKRKTKRCCGENFLVFFADCVVVVLRWLPTLAFFLFAFKCWFRFCFFLVRALADSAVRGHCHAHAHRHACTRNGPSNDHLLFFFNFW